MTLEEQSIYAMMGISPLVLTTQEVKDAKNAIVQVVLPGEAPKVVDSPAVEVDEPDPAPASVEPTPAPATESPKLVKRARPIPNESESTAEPKANAEASTIATVESPPEAEPLDADDAIATDDEDTAPKTRRRRRRRSSASGDDGES